MGGLIFLDNVPTPARDWGTRDRLDRPCSIRAIGRRPGRSKR